MPQTQTNLLSNVEVSVCLICLLLMLTVPVHYHQCIKWFLPFLLTSTSNVPAKLKKPAIPNLRQLRSCKLMPWGPKKEPDPLYTNMKCSDQRTVRSMRKTRERERDVRVYLTKHDGVHPQRLCNEMAAFGAQSIYNGCPNPKIWHPLDPWGRCLPA